MKNQCWLITAVCCLSIWSPAELFAQSGGGGYGGAGGFSGGFGAGGYGTGGYGAGYGGGYGGAFHTGGLDGVFRPGGGGSPHIELGPTGYRYGISLGGYSPYGIGGAYDSAMIGGGTLAPGWRAGTGVRPAWPRGGSGANAIPPYYFSPAPTSFLPSRSRALSALHRGPLGSGVADRTFIGHKLAIGKRLVAIAGPGYLPSFYGHPRYRGYWNWNQDRTWSPSLDREHWRRPLSWGLGAWGLGALIWDSGYWSYENPYVDASSASEPPVYDYSRPIPAGYSTPGDRTGSPARVALFPTVSPADEQLEAAIGAFRQQSYGTALERVDKGIEKYPSDAVLHEFRGLVLLARRDYQRAAATIHSLLAVGPGWDWATLSGLYGDVGVFTAQLRQLEEFARSRPHDGAAHFLLAYQYLCCGHSAAAAAQLREVAKLKPRDRIARDLLSMLAAADEQRESPIPTAPRPAQPQPAETPPDAQALAGTWRASRSPAADFELTLRPDSTCTWSHSRAGQPAQFAGRYAIERDLLIIERQDGGALIGRLTSQGDGKFNFRLVGAPPDDPGLDFSK